MNLKGTNQMPDAVAEAIEGFQDFLHEAFENDAPMLSRANEKFSDLLHVLEANRNGADDDLPPEFAKQLVPAIDFVRLAGDAAIHSLDFFKAFPQAARLR
jgi:hypothetical protein